MTAPIGSVGTPVKGIRFAGRLDRVRFFGGGVVAFGTGEVLGPIVGVPEGNSPGGAVLCEGGTLGGRALGLV
jgi:hypothetical protein